MENRREQIKQADRSDGFLWEQAYPRLVGWSVKRHRLGVEEAKEVVQEAIKQFLDAGGTADGDLRRLLEAVGSRINGVVINLHRKKVTKAVGVTEDGVVPEVGDEGQAVERVFSKDWASNAVGRLLERIGEDEVLTSMVMKMVEGIEAPSELAQALGVDVRVVYNARRRLAAHVAAVRTSMEDS